MRVRCFFRGPKDEIGNMDMARVSMWKALDSKPVISISGEELLELDIVPRR